MSVFDKLTEGIVNRDLAQEGAALLAKWEKTGLLEGLDTDNKRAGMARLLENQAKQLLKESSAMGAGDVQGFSAVAFPLVRRVFAGLFANDVVSVQPMSLPSGLIFFLDFTTSDDLGTGTGGLPRLGYPSATDDRSLFGGRKVGSQITGGLDLDGKGAELGPYALNNGYASPTGSSNATPTIVASGTLAGGGTAENAAGTLTDLDEVNSILKFDPDLVSGSFYVIGTLNLDSSLDKDNLVAVTVDDSASLQVRRLNQYSGSGDTTAYVVFTGGASANALSTSVGTITGHKFPLKDAFGAVGSSVGAVEGTAFGLEDQTLIPEIDIKVDSIAVTAQTKKLKAKWTPELGQDLNAYHNLDAEVELTSILSEQIALEIDHEILQDLINGATAGTYYWSRSPGLFVDRITGAEVGAGAAAPDFTGTVSEWYETLIETINDVSAQIHRKTLRGGANFVVTSPEMANIMEFTAGFRAAITADDQRGEIGAVRVGSLSKKFDVFVDPYFPRNLVLVGRRGASFLESGYVYAPYVPLQVTPTIFGVEDFTPRKGVMTRYAKQMVRPDMYGLVICRGLLGETGGT